MMSNRPPSAPGLLPAHQMQNQNYGRGSSPRTHVHGNSGQAAAGYRGSNGPIQPYAFTSTPNLNPNAPSWQPMTAYRTTSTPAVPTMHTFEPSHGLGRGRYPASASMTSLSTTQYNVSPYGSRDDSALLGNARRMPTTPRPQSSHMAGSYAQVLQHGIPSKNTPDRYRRPAVRNVDFSNASQQQQQLGVMSSSLATGGSGRGYAPRAHTEQRTPGLRSSPPASQRASPHHATLPGSAADDIQLYRRSDAETKKLRRRSMPTLDAADLTMTLAAINFSDHKEVKLSDPTSAEKDTAQVHKPVDNAGGISPEVLAHARTGSSESLHTNRSNGSRPSVSSL
jgi:hypothetical protein